VSNLEPPAYLQAAPASQKAGADFRQRFGVI